MNLFITHYTAQWNWIAECLNHTRYPSGATHVFQWTSTQKLTVNKFSLLTLPSPLTEKPWWFLYHIFTLCYRIMQNNAKTEKVVCLKKLYNSHISILHYRQLHSQIWKRRKIAYCFLVSSSSPYLVLTCCWAP